MTSRFFGVAIKHSGLGILEAPLPDPGVHVDSANRAGRAEVYRFRT
jgi:hypothetical protein